MLGIQSRASRVLSKHSIKWVLSQSQVRPFFTWSTVRPQTSPFHYFCLSARIRSAECSNHSNHFKSLQSKAKNQKQCSQWVLTWRVLICTPFLLKGHNWRCSWIEHLTSIPKALSSIPSTITTTSQIYNSFVSLQRQKKNQTEVTVWLSLTELDYKTLETSG